jgi:hypothetical protein
LVLRRSISLNGRTFFVTQGVYQALRELRLEGKERVLWIDALCINQADHLERQEQVQQMHQIYENAVQVMVWLGEAPRDAGPAFECFKRFSDDSTVEGKTQILSKAPRSSVGPSSPMALTPECAFTYPMLVTLP